jgi:tetratricopeptide (TPR) repeat protein
MAISDIIFCFLLGLCNYFILRELFTYGIKAALVSVAIKRIITASYIGLFIFIAGGIAHRIADFNPNLKSLLNWSLVFIFPLILAFITKGKLDPGWSSLEKGKALWKSLYPRFTYRDGVIEPDNSKLRDDPTVIQAKYLIRQSIDFARQTNVDSVQALANAATAWQEFGLLHRVLNEFLEAEDAFRQSLRILDEVGGCDSDDRSILVAYRETTFRLGELYHVTSKSGEARKYYLCSLYADEKLGHDDPCGEQATRNFLKQIKESD